MAWTAPKSDAIEEKAWTPPAGDAIAPAKAPAKKEAPGWFEPGSKSEAAVRGFSQGATLGFGDELQALIRSVGSDQTYSQLRDEQRGANAASSQANPGTYLAGNVLASAPAFAAGPALAGKLGLAKAGQAAGVMSSPLRALTTSANIAPKTAAIGGAIVGGASGLGAGEGDFSDQALSTGLGAGLGAAAGAGAAKLGKAGIPGVKTVKAFVANPDKEMTLGAGLGALGALATGNSVTEGIIAGGVLGRGGAVPVVKKIASMIPSKLASASRGVPLAQATTAALQNITGQKAKKIATAGEQEIQSSIARGQPEAAARFQALGHPEYRAAVARLEAHPDEDEGDTEE